MKVLIACEESQRVCAAFRERGHTAFSCDILPCSGNHPEWHINQDCLPLLNGSCVFKTQNGQKLFIDGAWDLIIAHPPCTHLAVSGARYFKAKAKDGRQEEAVNFFMEFTKTNCKKVAIENPVGIMSTRWRKPDQYIQPYMFGDRARKKTGLWLIGLPKLEPTNIVDPGHFDIYGCSIEAGAAYARDENGKILAWNDPKTAIIRSRTFKGIAKAMAEQWG